jgi:hypothetical protein
MSFWTDGKIEPKRQNRWVIQFDGIHEGNMYFASKVARPTMEISNKEHKFLNHTFNYPGRVTWKPISLTVVDTAGGGSDAGDNAMNQILSILQNSGYVVPQDALDGPNLGTIAKNRAIAQLSGGALDANGITIKMVNADGVVIEKWTLKNAFITKITPSELSYEDDGIATIDLEITYDYCEFFNSDTEVDGKFKPGPPSF